MHKFVIKKVNVGNLSKDYDMVFSISSRFITISCILNKTFRIVYDQETKKFINSCKYCGKHCKVKKIINKYIKRGEPFNFKDLVVAPKKRKRQRKTKNKKI